MIILSINTCLDGSTGKIIRQISEVARSRGIEAWTATSYQKKINRKITKTEYDITIGNYVSLYSHIFLSHTFGLSGIYSIFATKKLIHNIDKIKPDIIHLHNLHDSYINLELLFDYIKRKKIKVVWSLHDCWAFTGRCPYFQITNCEKWIAGCEKCPYPKYEYPVRKTDRSTDMWLLKKKWFSDVVDLTVVTPSIWLSTMARKSFLKQYDIRVINNGIDLTIFQPTNSNFIEKHALNRKKIILGVAFDWGRRKGLDVFIKLANSLDESYKVVLVGTNDEVDKILPSNILSIHKTQNQNELAEIYTAADLFVNPTREENYPTVNMESIACGTPVITFDTGGSPEIIDTNCGFVVPYNDFDSLLESVKSNSNCKKFMKNACLDKASEFDMYQRFADYVNLYELIASR